MVVIGVAAYVLSQPKEGTVEYHKAGYREALNAMKSGGWLRGRFVPEFVRDWSWHRNDRLSSFHQQALIDAGYLKKRWFVVSNASPNDVLKRALKDLDVSGFDLRFTVLWAVDNHTIGGIVPIDAMERVSQALRNADVHKPDLAESE